MQLEKICKGKDILLKHGIETDVFFAPAHSFDDNTLRALAECGFKYVSDGYSKRPYERYGIKMLPFRIGMPNFNKKKGYFTAVMHAHEWVFEIKANAYLQYQEIITNHSSEIVTFDIFKEWRDGISLVEILREKIYLFYRLSKLSLLKSRLAHLLKNR